MFGGRRRNNSSKTKTTILDMKKELSSFRRLGGELNADSSKNGTRSVSVDCEAALGADW